MKIALILPHTQEENGIMTTGEYSKHDGYEHKYAQLIQEFGHEATVYYFSHKREIKHFKHAYGHDVVRVPITFGFGPGKQISLQLLKVLKDDKPDVVHILSYYALEYDVLAVWSKINGGLRNLTRSSVRKTNIQYPMSLTRSSGWKNESTKRKHPRKE